MSHTSVLARMLHPHHLIALEDNYSRKKAHLVEHQTPDSSFEILNIPDDAFVIDLDAAFSNQTLFQGKAGECKRADYLIISESVQRILFIEMKRANSATEGHIANQLRGALCVFEYCQSIAREFFQERDFLSSYQKRFISICHTSAQKRKTPVITHTAEIGESHCTPETALKISGFRVIQFNKLAA